MFLSVVIAVYNEEDNVEKLTERIYASLTHLKIPFELIYVVDGNDSSFEKIRRMSKIYPNIKIDHSPIARGFRNSFMIGFGMIDQKTTQVLTLDADLNHRPEEIKNLIHCMNESNADIVIGSRYVRGGSIKKAGLFKRAVSLLANIVTELFFNLHIKDKTSGFRLYKKHILLSILPSCTLQGFEFLFEILLVAKMKGYIVKEVPILFETREHGESKFRLFKTIKGYVEILHKYSFQRNY